MIVSVVGQKAVLQILAPCTLGVPDEPLSRLHIDFTDPFIGKHFIILVDEHSKWLEVGIVPSSSSQSAIRFLCNVTHSIPEQLVSDNCSTLQQRVQNLSHLQWSYHSSSNSLA